MESKIFARPKDWSPAFMDAWLWQSLTDEQKNVLYTGSVQAHFEALGDIMDEFAKAWVEVEPFLRPAMNQGEAALNAALSNEHARLRGRGPGDEAGLWADGKAVTLVGVLMSAAVSLASQGLKVVGPVVQTDDYPQGPAFNGAVWPLAFAGNDLYLVPSKEAGWVPMPAWTVTVGDGE